MPKKNNATTEEYKKTMLDLAETISKTMNEVGQGYAFSVLPQIDDERAHFSAFGMPKNDKYVSFWAGIAALISDTKDSIPEDDWGDFREGFIAMVKMVGALKFPLLDTDELTDEYKKGE